MPKLSEKNVLEKEITKKSSVGGITRGGQDRALTKIAGKEC